MHSGFWGDFLLRTPANCIRQKKHHKIELETIKKLNFYHLLGSVLLLDLHLLCLCFCFYFIFIVFAFVVTLLSLAVVAVAAASAVVLV